MWLPAAFLKMIISSLIQSIWKQLHQSEAELHSHKLAYRSSSELKRFTALSRFTAPCVQLHEFSHIFWRLTFGEISLDETIQPYVCTFHPWTLRIINLKKAFTIKFFFSR